jgi:hypothetical protein
MADVTGRIYEAFIEFLLRRAGYRDEWTEGNGPQYLYERHREALCHQNSSICPRAKECSAHSRQHSIPFGPWYDPDFFILQQGLPSACVHVTHWSNPRSSKYKFWRTIEDHFQYKTNFGKGFFSLNAVFEGTPSGTPPDLLRDTVAKYPLHGWDPAIASVLVSSFDASLVFPRGYDLLKRFVKALPPKVPSNSKAKRLVYNQTWEMLCSKDPTVEEEIKRCVALLKKAFAWPPHPRYSTPVIQKLQKQCFEGRQRAVGVKPTLSRYRKGIQHAFILREVLGNIIGSRANPDDILWRVLNGNSRFPTSKFRDLLGVPASITDVQLDSVSEVLAGIPVRMEKRAPHYLLIKGAGAGHSKWDSDFSYFIQTIRRLAPAATKAFRMALEDLFKDYRSAQGVPDVMRDLSDPKRVRAKVAYIFQHYAVPQDKASFVRKLSADLLTPGSNPAHQSVARDVHNWVLDGILTAYGLGSVQEISNRLPDHFQSRHGHALSAYAFQGDSARLVGHLIAGVEVAKYFRSNAILDESSFYKAINPLIAECLWEAIEGIAPRSQPETEFYYCHGKAGRIISASDLEPIKFLFRREVPRVGEGPILRGCFNQLSSRRDWGNSALTTHASGQDPLTGAVIQTQTVVGKKHIADKTRELAARLRSMNIDCGATGEFSPSDVGAGHFLVVDGDWPIGSKINLYEAGFDGIFEIGELSQLAETLGSLANKDCK